MKMVKQSFYAGFLAMSVSRAMRGLTLQRNQLFLCQLRIWNFQHMNLCLNCQSFVCMSGKIIEDIWDCCKGSKLHSIYLTVGIVEHRKICLATIPYYSTDSELVILVSLTHTYCVVMTPRTCQFCELPVTVKHILVECTNLRDIREEYFTVSSVIDLFNCVDNHN